MAFSVVAIKAAKGRAKSYKLADTDGLCLAMAPNGAPYWRMNYRHLGKQKTLAFGVWPDTGLADVRGAARRSAQGAGARRRSGATNQAGTGCGNGTVLDIGNSWKHNEVSGMANTDIAKGRAVVGFQLASAKQVIQIAQTIVVEGATSITKQSGAAAAPAGTAPPVPVPQLADKGTRLYDPSAQRWVVFSIGETNQRVVARGLPGDSALQFTIAAASETAYAAGASMPIDNAIKAGDILIVAFLARAPSALTPEGSDVLGARIQSNTASYNGFADHIIAVAPGSKLYQIKTRSMIHVPAGQGVLSFHLAGAKQMLEIGRAYVIKAPAP